ncbi:intein-encoded DNA endonuclease-like protein [Anoxybacillus tengchongensis]|uniref:Intein-encoded DNA endonuclease-like protein n=1 Tax=Anoxybacillus tengchongensis TaxID=576944 RepID=A0A7W9YQZ3_9BACL|nr:carboxypeptidase-like regulatory domain-containing protein [Anoxybacillus tengchongensis]MBB6176071.1 intein-encoded DNA endonuclease-like protein [Anoxybacillus tengchongensis]
MVRWMKRWRKQISIALVSFLLFTYLTPFVSAETSETTVTNVMENESSVDGTENGPSTQPSNEEGEGTIPERANHLEAAQSSPPSEESPTVTEEQSASSPDVTAQENDSSSTTSEKQGTLQGVLVRGQEVVANTTFSFHSVDSSGQDVIWYDVTTDENGMFTAALPDGEYQIDGVWISPHWYVLQQKFSMVKGALVGANELVVDVTVKSSESSEKYNVLGTLKKGADVLKGITFSVHTLDGSKWYDATTDEAGQFGFKLPDGTYQLDGVWVGSENKWYAFDNYHFAVENGVLKDVTSLIVDVKATNNSQAEKNVKGTLKKGADVLQGITFSIHTLDGSKWYDATTDEAGQFGFKLPDGTYQLDGVWVGSENKWYAFDNYHFAVENGVLKDVTSLIVDVKATNNSQTEKNVKGTLKKGADVLQGITFSIHTLDGSKWYDATTDEAGQFGFNLPDGTYQLDGVWVGSENKWYAFDNYHFAVENGVLKDVTSLIVDVKATNNSQAEKNVKGTLKKGADVLQGITFSIHTLDGSKWYDATTDEAGQFGFKLPDGTYQLDGVWVGSENKWYAFDNYHFAVENGVLKDVTSLIVDVKATNNSQTEKNVKGTLKKGADVLQGITFSIHTLDGSKWYDATTDEAGQFGFKLPDGTYQLDGVWIDKESKWYVLAHTFTVENGTLKGANELIINVEAKGPVTFKGTLLHGNTPVENAVIWLQRQDGSGEFVETTTDENGRFAFRLSDGVYYVTDAYSEQMGAVFLNKKVEIVNGKIVAGGKEVNELQIQVPSYELKTKVIEDGAVVKHATLYFQPSGTIDFYYYVEIDENGSIESVRLADGVYRVFRLTVGDKDIDVDVLFTVENGQLFVKGVKQDVLNISISKTPFRGQLLEANGPIGNTLVHYLQYTNKGTQYDSLRTDENGYFTRDLEEGSYHIYGASIDEKFVSLNVPFEIKNGKTLVNGQQVETLVVKVPSVNFKGTVVEQDQTPVPSVRVEINNNSGWGYVFNADQKGRFSLRLPDGDYKLSEVDGVPLNISFSIRNGEMYVNDSKKTSLTVTLPPIRVFGNIYETGNVPLANAWVSVRNESYEYWHVQTDREGKFHLRIPDGKFVVNGVYEKNFINMAVPFEIREGMLTVNGGTQEKLELTVPRVSVIGNVYMANGELVKNANITITLEDEDSFSYGATIDQNGQFSLRLPDGQYKVSSVYGTNIGHYGLNVSFNVINGELYVGDVKEERLRVQLQPITLKGQLLSRDAQTIKDAHVLVAEKESQKQYGAYTDENGYFRLSIPDGSYMVDALSLGGQFIDLKSEGYTFQIQNGQLYINGEQKEMLYLFVAPITLKGQLLDANGIPQDNVTISFQLLDSDKDYPAQTNAKGEFAVRLPDGNYKVSGYYLRTERKWVNDDIRFAIVDGKLYVDGERQSNLLVVASSLTTINGYVDGGGLTVANATIYYKNKATDIVGDVVTDSNGNFTLKVSDGDYVITSIHEATGVVNVDISFSVKNGNLFMGEEEKETLVVSLPKVSVYGRVFDSKGFVGNVHFIVYGKTSDSKNYFSSQHTDGAGNFILRIPDGQYVIGEVYSEEWRTYHTNVKFSVVDGQLYVSEEKQERLLVSIPDLSLKGTLLDGDVPVGDVSIQIYEEYTDTYSSVSTNKNGEFVGRLKDGSYKATTVWLKNQSAYLDVAFSIVDGKLFVNGKQQDSLIINLTPVTVKGILKDNNGNLANVYINLKNTKNDNYFSATTDASGNFSFRLPDGEYFLDGLYVKGKGWVDLNRTIVVKNGTTDPSPFVINVDDPIPVYGNVQGTVLDGDKPLGKVNVEIKNEDTKNWMSTKTNDIGQFGLTLEDGNYRITQVYGTNFPYVQLNQTFSVQNGQLFVNGTQVAKLTVQIPAMIVLTKLVEGETPLANTTVYLMNVATNEMFNVQTNSAGEIKERLADGDYFISEAYTSDYRTFSIHRMVTVANGQTTSSVIDVNKEIPTYEVKGALFDEGSPLANATVYIRSARGYDFTKVQTNEDGQFSAWLKDGVYTIDSVANKDIGRVSLQPWNMLFVVFNGKMKMNGEIVPSLQIHLPPVTFVGKLQDGTKVLANQTFEISFSTVGWYYLSTNENGEFKLRLPDGQHVIYSISIEGIGNGIPLNQSFEIKNGVAAPNPLVIDLSKPVPVTGTVKGVVVDENGNPVRFARVKYQKDGYGWNSLAANSLGEFGLFLSDGNYQIIEIEGKTVGYTTTKVNIPFSVQNGVLMVNGQEKDKLTVQLPSINVFGEVKDNVGPISNAMLGIRDLVNGSYYDGITDNDGQFGLRLADSQYELTMFSQGTLTSNPIYYNFEVKNGKLLVNGVELNQLTISLPPVTLKGTVVEDNVPIKEAGVLIAKRNSTTPILNTMQLALDQNGVFSARLEDGEYVVLSVYPFAYGTEIPVSVPFTIEGGVLKQNGETKESLIVPIPSKATVEGKITKNGIPIKDGVLHLTSSYGGFHRFYTDGNGEFALRLPDGEYYIKSIWLQDLGEVILNRKITVTNGTTDPLPYNIEITDPFPIFGNVKGVVLDGEKSGITGKISIISKNTYEYYQVPVNTLGKFGIELKDGTYSVISFYDGKEYRSINQEFQVQDGKIVVDGTIQDKLTLYLQ